MKAEKPNYNFINPQELPNQVNNILTEYCSLYGIDLYNYKERSSIKHNEVNNILRYMYNRIFKPSTGLYNNQRSLLNYDDIEQLQSAVDVFLNICSLFNKALGLWSFCIFTGIDDNTVIRWSSEEGKQSNPIRWELLKSIKEYNKGALISNLKDTPVGALAVANNDHDTGLEWSKNQAAALAVNTVYLLPSERVDRMKLDKPED